MPPSRLDGLYRRLLITKFFTKGWGQPDNLQKLFEFRKIISNRESCTKLIPPDYPVEITKDEQTSDCRILEGKFLTPLEIYIPGIVPKCAQDAHFQMIIPNKWHDDNYRPMCIHLAGTGDHHYWRRRNFVAKPLMKEAGIGAILLENPFYGARKPKDQIRSCLHNVSDIFVMGGCLILESLVLLNWCERNGFGPLGITGLSMGGHMASLAATNWPKPLVLVPCLSWSTAASVFTQGVMSQSINWDNLENQFLADGNYCDRLAKMVQVVDEDSFLAGKQFIKKFNQSMKELKSDLHDVRQQFDSTTKVVPMTENNDLLRTLLSKDATDFTNFEINMINNRIKQILTSIEEERRIEEEQMRLAQQNKEKSELTLEAATNAITNATHGISSYIYAGSTKLMSLILPQKDAVQNERNAAGVVAANTSAATTKLIELIKTEKIDITKTNWWEREALQFMRGVMDECTHLKNFSVPYDTSLITAVCAKDDAYVPRDGCTSLEDIWPGAEIKYLDAGHVSAYVLHQKLFRSCIIETFERAKKKLGPLPNPAITTEFLNFTKTKQITDNARP